MRDEIRQNRDPGTIEFDARRLAEYQRRYNTHAKFVLKSKTLLEAVKPKHFTNNTKWMDWALSFVNYLRTIPGKDRFLPRTK